MTAPGDAYSHKVLIVDDDAALLDVAARHLKSQGLQVIMTTDPEKVVALAKLEQPQLILSDIAMPGMDGLSLLKALKADPQTQNIPHILLTSSRDPQDIQEGLNFGAEAYLTKPLDWAVCWPKIQSILLRS